MIKVGRGLNESFTGDLATAAKSLTKTSRMQMMRGLGDIDIQNSDIKPTKLTSARDSRLKSGDNYLFLVFKDKRTSKLQLAVFDETKKQCLVDPHLGVVINAEGKEINISNPISSVGWTKRIEAANSIYILSKQDAARMADKQADRKAAKEGSAIDYRSKGNYRAPDGLMWKEMYDKSGYLKRNLTKELSARKDKVDLEKDIETLDKLFTRVTSSINKANAKISVESTYNEITQLDYANGIFRQILDNFKSASTLIASTKINLAKLVAGDKAMIDEGWTLENFNKEYQYDLQNIRTRIDSNYKDMMKHIK